MKIGPRLHSRFYNIWDCVIYSDPTFRKRQDMWIQCWQTFSSFDVICLCLCAHLDSPEVTTKKSWGRIVGFSFKLVKKRAEGEYLLPWEKMGLRENFVRDWRVWVKSREEKMHWQTLQKRSFVVQCTTPANWLSQTFWLKATTGMWGHFLRLFFSGNLFRRQYINAADFYTNLKNKNHT